MTLLEDQSNLIAVIVGVVRVLAALSLLMARRTRLRQRLPLHPPLPLPGTQPRMRRGLRTPVR